jgi:hypothetical protein
MACDLSAYLAALAAAWSEIARPNASISSLAEDASLSWSEVMFSYFSFFVFHVSLFIVVCRWRRPNIGRDANGDAIIPKRSTLTGFSYGGLPSLLG